MLQKMQKQVPDMLAVLKQLVELESPSTNKAAVDQLIQFLVNEVERRGGRPEVIKQTETGNHLRAEWGSGEDQVLILCHIDTVWDVGEILQRPFRVEGDKAYGPGIYDMKAGTVQTLFALDAIRAAGWDLDCRVVVIVNSDEEIGSTTSRPLIEAEARRSRAVFVLEPSVPPQGALKTSRKGVGSFTMKVSGVAAHAGSAPQDGASAIQELALQTIRLHTLTDYDKGTTVNVGVVRGGSRSNVVADHAEAEIDLRVVTQTEAERVVPQIFNSTAHTPGTKVEVSGGMNRPPMERTPQIVELYRLAERLAGELGIAISEGSTGGGSDGNFTAALGIPTLDGLGAVGDGAHAVHEHLSISKLPERTALLARLLQEVGRA